MIEVDSKQGGGFDEVFKMEFIVISTVIGYV